MAEIFPFAAWRYNPARVKWEDVLTQPYDKITPEMQQRYAALDPHNLIAVEKDIVAAKAKSAKFNEPPREAWMLECVQEDRNNPKPCTEADKKKFLRGEDVVAPGTEPKQPEPGVEKVPNEDELLEQMLNEKEGDGGTADDTKGGEPKDKGKPSDDDKELEKMFE